MSASSPQKLTKKQKKAIAFRERKQGKGKSKENADVALDVPVTEDQDMVEVQNDGLEVQEKVGGDAGGSSEHDKGSMGAKQKDKGKATREEELGTVGKQKKRKRDVDVESEREDREDEAKKPKPNRKKGTRRNDEGVSESAGGDPKESKEVKSQVKQRYILFVGNLKYTTSLEAIKEHFSACDPPPIVRLLSPKSASQKSTTNKSKGCAFLEFSHRNALQQALKQHQSELDGRRINVELTAGGGGKSESRLSKLRERNKELHGQRKKRIEQQEQGDSQPERPQRYSTTSGIQQENAGKRTWTVGDIEDDGGTHRGGRKHAKSKKGRPRAKDLGTGVNAIPVG